MIGDYNVGDVFEVDSSRYHYNSITSRTIDGNYIILSAKLSITIIGTEARRANGTLLPSICIAFCNGELIHVHDHWLNNYCRLIVKAGEDAE